MRALEDAVADYLVYDLHGVESRLHRFMLDMHRPKATESMIDAYDRYMSIAVSIARTKFISILPSDHIIATHTPGGRMFIGRPYMQKSIGAEEHIVLLRYIEGLDEKSRSIESFIFFGAEYMKKYPEAVKFVHDENYSIELRYIFALVYPYVKARNSGNAIEKTLDCVFNQRLKYGKYETGIKV